MRLVPIPKVRDCMTASPIVIAPGEKLARAKRLMDEHVIRHLPVIREGALVGILSDRDVYMVQLVETRARVEPDAITVEDAMMADPFAVSPDAPLDVVAREMAGRRIGSAVVVEHGATVGVLTATDALRALAHVLGGGDLASP